MSVLTYGSPLNVNHFDFFDHFARSLPFMPPLPPWNEVTDALRFLIAPALGASLLVMVVCRFLGGQRFSALASALALAAGVIGGNYFRETFHWRIDSERPLNDCDLRTVLGWSLEGKPAVEPVEGEPEKYEPPRVTPLYWLPWLAGAAMLIELLARLLPMSPGAGWVARTFVAILAGRLLTAASLRVDEPWVPWALSLTILLEWAILQTLARRWTDGTIAAGMTLCLGISGVIILHAPWNTCTDMAMLFSVSLAGLALIAWIRPSDTGAAMAGIAVVMPGLMLIVQQGTESLVPWRSYFLAGLAPVALLPMLLTDLSRQQRWRRWIPAIILPLIPAIWALVLAAEAETIKF